LREFSESIILISYPILGESALDFVLQRTVRKQSFFSGTQVRNLTSSSKMRKNFRITYVSKDGGSCEHSSSCGCQLSIEGIGMVTKGYHYQPIPGTIEQQYREIAVHINSYSFSRHEVISQVQTEASHVRAMMHPSGTVQSIPKPVDLKPQWPNDVLLCSLDPRVTHALRRADYRYMRQRFNNFNISWADMQAIWSGDRLASLQNQCLRQESMFQWACGRSNDKPHVVAAMANLYPQKVARTIAEISRLPLGDRPRDALKYLNDAMDMLYRHMRVDLSRLDKWKLDFRQYKEMYMGASNGPNLGEHFEIQPTNERTAVHVSPTGKKVDTFEQDIESLLEFLRTGKEPGFYWKQALKDENFFSFTKQWDSQKWIEWTEKCRVFCIPNSLFIMLERLVSSIRHARERGWVIRVGHRWSRGGADTIAKCLGINLDNCFDPCMVEGDAQHFDQSVWDMWIDLYWSTMSNFVDKASPDFLIFEAICKLLLKNFIVRITNLIGDVWGLVKGGVPSGALIHRTWILG